MRKKLWYIAAGVIILIVGIFLATRTIKNQPSPAPAIPSQQIQRNASVPVNSTPTSAPTQNSAASPAQDPQDIVAGLYKNQIQNNSTQEGFLITDSKVENNTDKAGKVIDDHLELTIKNTAGKDITDFEVYYTITDTVTNQKEGYYKKLDGFVLKSGETTAIHFDNGTDPGHFTVNKNSLYYKSPNKMAFDVTVSAAGYKIQTVQISKDAGGAEQND